VAFGPNLRSNSSAFGPQKPVPQGFKNVEPLSNTRKLFEVL